MNLPGILLWSNQEETNTITRSQDLTVTWSGADGSQEVATITGTSADPSAGAGATFICSAPAGAGTFTVPSWVLSALPASGQAAEGPVGFLAVAKTPLRQAATFQAPGIDLGFRRYNLIRARNLTFQ